MTVWGAAAVSFTSSAAALKTDKDRQKEEREKKTRARGLRKGEGGDLIKRGYFVRPVRCGGI